VLCAMSLLALVVAHALGMLALEGPVVFYLIGLTLALVLPWIPLPIGRWEKGRREALESGGPVLSSIWCPCWCRGFPPPRCGCSVLRRGYS
jgi:hypothetical protein